MGIGEEGGGIGCGCGLLLLLFWLHDRTPPILIMSALCEEGEEAGFTLSGFGYCTRYDIILYTARQWETRKSFSAFPHDPSNKNSVIINLQEVRHVIRILFSSFLLVFLRR